MTEPAAAAAPRIERALISVSDKTGLVDFARALAGARRRDPVDRRHGAGAEGCRHRREGRLRAHRLPRDDGRPAQDAAPGGPRRPAGGPRQCRARARRRSARHRAHRPAGGQPLPLRGDGGEGRALRRVRREHRHRRPRHDPRRGQEPRRRHGGGRCGGLRGGPGRDDATWRRHQPARCARRWRPRPTRARRPTTRPSATGSPRRSGERAPRRRAFAGRLAQELRYGENPHQRAAFYRDRASAARAWRRPCSTRARSSPTTTSATPTPPSSWWPSSIPKSAGGRHHQARQPVRRRRRRHARWRPTPRRSAAIPSARSAASSRSTGPIDAATAARSPRSSPRSSSPPMPAPRPRRSSPRKKNLRLLTTGGLPDPRGRASPSARSPAASWCSRATTPWSTTSS